MLDYIATISGRLFVPQDRRWQRAQPNAEQKIIKLNFNEMYARGTCIRYFESACYLEKLVADTPSASRQSCGDNEASALT